MPSLFRRATAGATILRSSSPSVPSSPACGLSPAIASRGRGRPNRADRSCATMRPVSTIRSIGKLPEDLFQRQMDCDRHDCQFRRPQHHHGTQRSSQSLPEPAWPEIRCVQVRQSPNCRARSWRPDWSRPLLLRRHYVRDSAADRSDGRRSAGTIRMAGLGAYGIPRWQPPEGRRQISPQPYRGVTVAIGTSRPS